MIIFFFQSVLSNDSLKSLNIVLSLKLPLGFIRISLANSHLMCVILRFILSQMTAVAQKRTELKYTRVDLSSVLPSQKCGIKCLVQKLWIFNFQKLQLLTLALNLFLVQNSCTKQGWCPHNYIGNSRRHQCSGWVEIIFSGRTKQND